MIKARLAVWKLYIQIKINLINKLYIEALLVFTIDIYLLVDTIFDVVNILATE